MFLTEIDLIHLDALRKITAVCDTVKVYIDGNLRNSSTYPDLLTFSIVGMGDKIIAVSCERNSGPGKLLLSTDDGLVSDNSWLCTDDVTGSAWTKYDFDDSTWQQAEQFERNIPDESSTEFDQIEPFAKWIWLGSSSKIFCRKGTSTPFLANPVTYYVDSVDDCARRCLLGSACDMFEMR